MSYCAVHMQKFKRADVKGIENHIDRVGHLKNDLIDSERTHLNYDLIPQSSSLLKDIDGLISEHRTSGRAIRKDAVVLCNFVVTSDKAFFDGLSGQEQEDFFRKSAEFFKGRYPERVVNATVHLDETTPHMHLGVVPITQDGRLTAKEIFNRNELRAIQTDFYEEVGRSFGLERGIEGSTAKHIDSMTHRANEAKQAVLQKENELKRLDALIASKNELYGDFEGFEGKVLTPPKKVLKTVYMSSEDYDELSLTAIQSKSIVHDLKQKNVNLEDELEDAKKQLDELHKVIHMDLFRVNQSLEKELKYTNQSREQEKGARVKAEREAKLLEDALNAVRELLLRFLEAFLEHMQDLNIYKQVLDDSRKDNLMGHLDSKTLSQTIEVGKIAYKNQQQRPERNIPEYELE